MRTGNASRLCACNCHFRLSRWSMNRRSNDRERFRFLNRRARISPRSGGIGSSGATKNTFCRRCCPNSEARPISFTSIRPLTLALTFHSPRTYRISPTPPTMSLLFLQRNRASSNKKHIAISTTINEKSEWASWWQFLARRLVLSGGDRRIAHSRFAPNRL